MTNAAAPGSATVRSRAGDGDEDEEARLWAELERLPTPQRARNTVVTLEEEDDGGGAAAGACRKAVVDVGELCSGQRRTLLDRLVGSVEHDNERFLRKLRERIDRYVRVHAVMLIVDKLIASSCSSSGSLHFSVETGKQEFACMFDRAVRVFLHACSCSISKVCCGCTIGLVRNLTGIAYVFSFGDRPKTRRHDAHV